MIGVGGSVSQRSSRKHAAPGFGPLAVRPDGFIGLRAAAYCSISLRWYAALVLGL